MMATRTTHPPAGSNPVIVFLAQPGVELYCFSGVERRGAAGSRRSCLQQAWFVRNGIPRIGSHPK
jgi:hypothetical protein